MLLYIILFVLVLLCGILLNKTLVQEKIIEMQNNSIEAYKNATAHQKEAINHLQKALYGIKDALGTIKNVEEQIFKDLTYIILLQNILMNTNTKNIRKITGQKKRINDNI